MLTSELLNQARPTVLLNRWSQYDSFAFDELWNSSELLQSVVSLFDIILDIFDEPWNFLERLESLLCICELYYLTLELSLCRDVVSHAPPTMFELTLNIISQSHAVANNVAADSARRSAQAAGAAQLDAVPGTGSSRYPAATQQ